MGWKDRVSKAGRFANKHKGMFVKSIELHPGAAMLLKMRELKGQDKARAAADILAHLIDEDHQLGSPFPQAAVAVLDPVVEAIREALELTPEQMQSVLRRLSEKQGE